jgi:hypothetical protein
MSWIIYNSRARSVAHYPQPPQVGATARCDLTYRFCIVLTISLTTSLLTGSKAPTCGGWGAKTQNLTKILSILFYNINQAVINDFNLFMNREKLIAQNSCVIYKISASLIIHSQAHTHIAKH